MIQPYDRLRYEAGVGLFDWRTQPMALAIPKLGYAPSIEEDQTITVAQPFRSTPAEIMEKEITPAGWFQSLPVSINAVPINEAFDKFVIYRISDSALLLLASFPPIVSTTGQPVILYYGIANLGFCRL